MIRGYDCQSASLCLKSSEKYAGNAAQFEMVVVPDTRYPNFLTDGTAVCSSLANCAKLRKAYRDGVLRQHCAYERGWVQIVMVDSQ